MRPFLSGRTSSPLLLLFIFSQIFQRTYLPHSLPVVCCCLCRNGMMFVNVMELNHFPRPVPLHLLLLFKKLFVTASLPLSFLTECKGKWLFSNHKIYFQKTFSKHYLATRFSFRYPRLCKELCNTPFSFWECKDRISFVPAKSIFNFSKKTFNQKQLMRLYYGCKAGRYWASAKCHFFATRAYTIGIFPSNPLTWYLPLPISTVLLKQLNGE